MARTRAVGIGAPVVRAVGALAAPDVLHPAVAAARAAIPTIVAPVVAADGRLSGYANFDVQLEVDAEKEAEVTEKLPLLLNAINLRTWSTPLAAGPDHILPDLRAFARVVDAAAQEIFGKKMVRRVIVTGARPA